VLLAWLGLGLAVGVVAGSYPAFYLSSFAPARVLKGTLGSGGGGITLRRVLVVGQFAVSIVLLVGIGTIARQVAFMKSQDLGFDEEEILFVRSRSGVEYEAFKQALGRHPDVLEVVGGNSVPGSGNAAPIAFQMFRASGADAGQRLQMASTSVEAGYDGLFGLRLAEGRFFAPAFTDDRSVVVNRSAVRAFGWSGGAVGKQVEMFGMLGNSNGLFEVVGVVEDYHYESLHHRIQPIVLFTNGDGSYGNYILRIRTAGFAATTAYIEARWEATTADFPLEYFFLDQDLEGLYRQEERLSRLIGYFTLLAVFIAALGLFGLASYTAQQRTKEIGVRKVLGASVASIVVLLARDFLRLVVFAFAIGAPVAYLAMSRWLDGFAYQAGFSPGVFILAGGVAAGVALATVSYQAVRAGLADPVASLRYE
jgi:putative ABC transport system permease protein